MDLWVYGVTTTEARGQVVKVEIVSSVIHPPESLLPMGLQWPISPALMVDGSFNVNLPHIFT